MLYYGLFGKVLVAGGVAGWLLQDDHIKWEKSTSSHLQEGPATGQRGAHQQGW